MTSDKFDPDAKGVHDVDHEAIRLTAFFLWEQDGKPEGRQLEYWERAVEAHIRQKAYDAWLADGRPRGQAEHYWLEAEHQVRDNE